MHLLDSLQRTAKWYNLNEKKCITKESWNCWAEARIKIARMNLTFKLDRNWSSFQLANSAPPLSVTDSAIAPSARMLINGLRLGLVEFFLQEFASNTADKKSNEDTVVESSDKSCWQKLASCLPLKKFCYG